MKKIKAGIIGGAGYTGGEVLRLLLLHPAVEISFVHSRSNAGKGVSHLHQDLIGHTSLCFTDTIDSSVDVLFLCLGHGESRQFLAHQHQIYQQTYQPTHPQQQHNKRRQQVITKHVRK